MHNVIVSSVVVAEGSSIMHKLCILDKPNSGQGVTKSESPLPDLFALYGFSALDEYQIAVVGRQNSVKQCKLFCRNTY